MLRFHRNLFPEMADVVIRPSGFDFTSGPAAADGIAPESVLLASLSTSLKWDLGLASSLLLFTLDPVGEV